VDGALAIIDADGSCSKLREEERRAEHGDIFCEHGLLNMDGGGVVQLPERVHCEGYGQEESDQEYRTPAGLVAEGNAEPPAIAITPEMGTRRPLT
jgi:hypothetical protein